MTETKTVLVCLRPLRPWFFGSEQTFGEGAQRNYFAQSLMLPQQTSLLGLVRHQLLLQNGCLPSPAGRIPEEMLDTAMSLIGEAGFGRDVVRGYGKIERLSPVFVAERNGSGWTHWLPGPQMLRREKYKEMGAKSEERFGLLRLRLAEGSAMGPGGIRQPLPVVDGYERKRGTEAILVNTTGAVLRYKDVFKEHVQVGIEKAAGEADDENKYYRQQYYRFSSAQMAFGFYVKLRQTAEGGFPVFADTKVQFGGERSPFMMEVHDAAPDAWETLRLPAAVLPQGKSAIVLASDSWVDPDYHRHCVYEVSSVVDFRHHQSSLRQTRNWYRLSKVGKDDVRPSQRFRLLARGSVLFTDTVPAVTALLDQKPWQDIGYNRYFIVSPKD